PTLLAMPDTDVAAFWAMDANCVPVVMAMAPTLADITAPHEADWVATVVLTLPSAVVAPAVTPPKAVMAASCRPTEVPATATPQPEADVPIVVPTSAIAVEAPILTPLNADAADSASGMDAAAIREPHCIVSVVMAVVADLIPAAACEATLPKADPMAMPRPATDAVAARDCCENAGSGIGRSAPLMPAAW